MLGLRLKYFFTKLIALILAIQIVNISIHGGDFNASPFVQSQTTIGMYNSIDCGFEFVLETIVLQHDSTLFPDQGLHNQSKKTHKISQFIDNIYITPNSIQIHKKEFVIIRNTFHKPSNDDFSSLYVTEKLSPPPRLFYKI